MAPILSVIFDFDGVLADTERLHLSAFRRVFSARGWSLDEREYFDRYLGYDDIGLVEAYSRDRSLHLSAVEVDAIVTAKTEVFGRDLLSAAALYPGARACVARLAGEFSLAIASGALHHEIVSVLRSADLLSYFPIIVAADDVTRSKPSPEPYLAAAGGLGIPAAACVAVEDSAGGLASARGAGMHTVAITTSSPAQTLASDADVIIASLDELTIDLIRTVGARAVE